jgi:N-acetylmuramoyl-L-alanine amidase
MSGRSGSVPGSRRRVGGAVLALVAAVACTGPAPTAGGPPRSPESTLSGIPRPPIVSHLIPFPEERKREMLAYAEEHYGVSTYRLMHPKVVVEHFTATETFAPVFETFAADRPDLGELPGTCAHYVLDADGTIYQLVPLTLMCRHTVGLNDTAIGIEMVGTSDGEILARHEQLSAALRLTLWLMRRYGIELRNVIGHNESLNSPFHTERVPSFRCQTHQDWNHADMEVFRADLARLARTFHVPIGPPATPVDRGC